MSDIGYTYRKANDGSGYAEPIKHVRCDGCERQLGRWEPPVLGASQRDFFTMTAPTIESHGRPSDELQVIGARFIPTPEGRVRVDTSATIWRLTCDDCGAQLAWRARTEEVLP